MKKDKEIIINRNQEIRKANKNMPQDPQKIEAYYEKTVSESRELLIDNGFKLERKAWTYFFASPGIIDFGNDVMILHLVQLSDNHLHQRIEFWHKDDSHEDSIINVGPFPKENTEGSQEILIKEHWNAKENAWEYWVHSEKFAISSKERILKKDIQSLFDKGYFDDFII